MASNHTPLDALKQQPPEQLNGNSRPKLDPRTVNPTLLPEPPATLITVTRGYAYACPVVIAEPPDEPPITCGYYHTTPHNPIGPEGDNSWFYDWCPGCKTSLVVTAVNVTQHQNDHQWQWAVRRAGPDENIGG